MRENKESREQQVQVALAGARHRLAIMHQRFALERLAAFPSTPAAEVVQAYADTHVLDDLEAKSLANRVLATFAASSEPALPPPHPALPPPAPLVQPVSQGFFDRVFRRPPRDPEHEAWLAMHVGYTETALLHAHAENVVALLDAIGNDAAGVRGATDLYLRETDARPELADAIAILATDLLYRRHADLAGQAAAPPLTVEPANGPAQDHRPQSHRSEIDRIVQNRKAAGG